MDYIIADRLSSNKGSIGIPVNQGKILLGKRAKDPYKAHWSARAYDRHYF
jgi:hypothetical protein